MYYYFIIALQGYCLYHCFVNKNQFYWYFVILFLPLLGSLLYLFLYVFQKQDIGKVQEGLTAVINPTKKIADLEKKLDFSDTFENRVALADAYLGSEQYEKAIELYKSSLKGTFKKDYYAISNLIEALYYSEQYAEVIAKIKVIEDSPRFKKSKAMFLYGLALEKTGDIAKAETLLEQFNAPYSRYQERLGLAKFYIRNGQTEKARTILNDISTESVGMSKPSYKLHQEYIKKAKEMLATGL
ncbi:hypothetical protein LX92_04194 [Maribacter polysiphoniae]|uniref:Tetratricopeptide repeat protein n=1 Tax=Maribacter polysiphoniae TaxID=429344 RepID=A0A316DMQ5_9FLAO|nr:hypothetical protein LX92_04194 [Maribacter polysiphoniae]